MWQSEVGGSSDRATTYRDLLTKIVAAATSQHVATVAVNAGGTGYVTGDVVTLPHASGFLTARFEVTAAAGAITGLRIISSGAYSIRATSASVSVAGTGYVVGDIITVQGGTQRNAAKFSVATLTGSGVATVALVEDGGAYTTSPSNPAATAGVGPTAFAGDNACTLTVTYGTLIGTTALALTGGSGSSGTVDITLAETGQTVVRNNNNLTFNSITDEREVVLRGDAAGKTNKPYVAFMTGTSTSGINTRYFLALYGMTSHSPGNSMTNQVGLSPGVPTTHTTQAPFILCDEDQVQEMDFWLTINDYRIGGVININSGAANTDDGIYNHFYLGFMDSFATENEDPYPMMIAATSRQQNQDPSTGNFNHTGLGEAHGPNGFNTGINFFRSEDSTWQNVRNGTEVTADVDATTIMFPVGRTRDVGVTATVSDRSFTTGGGVPGMNTGICATNRASPTRRLMPVPGTTPAQLPFPLTVMHRPGGDTINTTLDTIRGQLAGFFFVYNTDSAGATIANFSEDYLEIGSDRYRVFHSHTQRNLYHFIAILEDV